MSLLLILAGSLFVNAAMLGGVSRTTARSDGRLLGFMLLPALLGAVCVEYALHRWVLPTWEQAYLEAPLMVALMVVLTAATSMMPPAALARRLLERDDHRPPQAVAMSPAAEPHANGVVTYDTVERSVEPQLTGERIWLLSNAALLGVAWCELPTPADFTGRLFTASGMAAVFIAATLLSHALRARIDERNVPRAFRGLPIALTTGGLVALALMAILGLG